MATIRLRFVNSFRNRSEEHTSELQSLRHLVCRLLLEKKKKKKKTTTPNYPQPRNKHSTLHESSTNTMIKHQLRASRMDTNVNPHTSKRSQHPAVTVTL